MDAARSPGNDLDLQGQLTRDRLRQSQCATRGVWAGRCRQLHRWCALPGDVRVRPAIGDLQDRLARHGGSRASLTERERRRWRSRRSLSRCRRGARAAARTTAARPGPSSRLSFGNGLAVEAIARAVQGWPGQPCIVRGDRGTHDRIPYSVETRRRQTSSATIRSSAAVARRTRGMYTDAAASLTAQVVQTVDRAKGPAASAR